MQRFAASTVFLAACSTKSPSDSGSAAPPAQPADTPDAGYREFDGTARYPGLSPQLLEAGARTILAVSPDEQRAVVSHQLLTQCSCNPHILSCTEANDVEV